MQLPTRGSPRRLPCLVPSAHQQEARPFRAARVPHTASQRPLSDCDQREQRDVPHGSRAYLTRGRFLANGRTICMTYRIMSPTGLPASLFVICPSEYVRFCSTCGAGVSVLGKHSVPPGLRDLFTLSVTPSITLISIYRKHMLPGCASEVGRH
jgi:hypothetical protein